MNTYCGTGEHKNPKRLKRVVSFTSSNEILLLTIHLELCAYSLNTFWSFDTEQGWPLGLLFFQDTAQENIFCIFFKKLSRANQARPTNSNTARRTLERRPAGGWLQGEEARSFEREAGAEEGRVLKPTS